MQHSGGGGSGSQRRSAADWSEAARKAHERASAGRAGVKIKCPGNTLLYFFLVELKSAMSADPERYRTALFGIRNAKESILQEACRVTCRQHLMALSGCKDMLSNIIERHLWSLYPPDEEDEEEKQLRQQRDAAAKAEASAAAAAKRAEKKQAKQQQQAAAAAATAAAAAGVGGFGSGGSSGGGSGGGVNAGNTFTQPGVASHDPLSELERILRRDPMAAALHAEVQRQAAAAAAAAAGGSSGGFGSAVAATAAGGASGGSQRASSAGRKRATAAVEAAAAAAAGADGAQPQPAPKKKRTTAPKEYVPAVGSANYAFLITLYLRHCTGHHHLSKDELITAAEASKLADVPIRGNTNGWAAQRGPGKWYDGWSCVKTLENRDVPLIQRWSNPIKIRLTAAGMALGAKLYKHATESGKMAQHPDVHPDDLPPPGSPTAAAAADLSAAAAAAAATKEAAAMAKKPRQRKGAAAAAAAGAAATDSQAGSGGYAAGSQQQQQQFSQQYSQQYSQPPRSFQQQQQQPDLSGLDPSVAAAIAAAQAAAASAARLGVVVDDPVAAANAAAAWGDDDPCMAGDGFWDPKPAAAAGGDGSRQRRRRPKSAAAAAAAGDDDVMDDFPVVISDDDDVGQGWGPGGTDTTAAAAAAANVAGGGSVTAGGAGTCSSQQQQQQQHQRSKQQQQQQSEADDGLSEGWGESDDEDVAAVINDIFEGDVVILVDMGFGREQAVKALKHVNGSLLEAITLLTDTPDILDNLPQQQQQQQQRPSQQQQPQQTEPGPSQPTQQSAAGGRQQQQQQSQQYGSQQQSQQFGSQQGSQPPPAAAAHRKPPRPDSLHRMASTAAAAAAAAGNATAAAGGGPSRRGSGFSGGPSRQGSGVSSGGSLGRHGSGISGGSSRGTAAAAAAAAAEDGGYIGLNLDKARSWQAPLLSEELSLPLPPLPAGTRFDSHYDVVMLIDQREQYSRAGPGARTLGRTESLRKHAGAIAAQGVKVVSTVTLPCGDVAWVAEHKVTKQRYLLDFLAERKSYSDLSSSIIDGRYTAQKWVMAGQDSAGTCFYIMEGSPADLNAYGQATSSKQQACVTALHRMLLHDGFKVMETGGPQDTVDLLANITKILVDVYGPRTSGSGSAGQQAQTLDSWKAGITTTRRTKTVRQKWQELLLSVAGIGEEAVCTVVAAYPTPISLYRAYETTIKAAISSGGNAVAAARGMLADLAQASGQRVGPSKAAVVYDKLFANGWNVAGQQD